jgi:hypothetical protein
MPAPGGAGPGFPLVSVYAAVTGGMKQDTASIPCAKTKGGLFGFAEKPKIFQWFYF